MVSHGSGVYEVLNTASNKRYIGSAVDFSKRWNQHRHALRNGQHHSPKLQHAWNKYGEEAFKFLPILVCQKGMLAFYEQQLLDKAKPEYNIALDATNPMLGRKHSSETRAKMSAALVGNDRALGKEFSAEHRAKIGAASIGRQHSTETKQRISVAKKGMPVAKRGPMSQAQRDSISAAKRATPWRMPDGQKAALTEQMRGNTFAKGVRYTAEQKAVMSAKRKATRAANMLRGDGHGI